MFLRRVARMARACSIFRHKLAIVHSVLRYAFVSIAVSTELQEVMCLILSLFVCSRYTLCNSLSNHKLLQDLHNIGGVDRLAVKVLLPIRLVKASAACHCNANRVEARSRGNSRPTAHRGDHFARSSTRYDFVTVQID